MYNLEACKDKWVRNFHCASWHESSTVSSTYYNPNNPTNVWLIGSISLQQIPNVFQQFVPNFQTNARTSWTQCAKIEATCVCPSSWEFGVITYRAHQTKRGFGFKSLQAQSLNCLWVHPSTPQTFFIIIHANY
jgi:hypothetical protein